LNKRIKSKIVAIVGPTASGKSALAVKLAIKLKGEIVSADSRQVYRGMNIGTAKPTKYEQKKIRHYLIDIKNPNKKYTVAEFKKDAIRAINAILHRGRLPILVGGTGLYVRAVVDNLIIPEAKADLHLRKELESELQKKGLEYLFQKLVKLDPEAAYIVDPKNPRRVIRALEITIKTGESFSKQRKRGMPLFDTLIIGLNPKKEILKRRIENRVDQMIKNGLVTEVKNLIKRYGINQKSFDAIGYREIICYLKGLLSLTETRELIKKNTVSYAKRQMTWFKKDKKIIWIGDKRKALLVARNS